MNSIMVIGHLGRDPEMKYTPNGAMVTEFSVAENRKWTDNAGATHEEVNWFNIHCWGRLAEVANDYLEKGRQVFVSGRLSARTYETRDNRVGLSLDVTARELQFLGGGQSGQQAEEEEEEEPAPPPPQAQKPATRGKPARRGKEGRRTTGETEQPIEDLPSPPF